MSYLDLTIKEIHEALKEGKVTPVQLTEEAIERVKADECNAFEALDFEGALKAARKYAYKKGTGRYEFIAMEDSFHGRTLATLTATGQDKFHKYFDPFPDGYDYVTPNSIEDFKEKLTDDVCAIIMEAIQGEGGVNLLNSNTNNFLSIESIVEEGAKLEVVIIDLGGNITVTNYYTNLSGKFSSSNVDSIYLGKDEQKIDINYIAHLNGEKSNCNIEVQGALKDKAIKNFKGTIDFKTGAVKSIGAENEFCMLLSDKAKSKALPMLLCTEEDVEGSHSTATGKVDESELFYLMTRGFSKKESMKLIVKANFSAIIDKINDESLKEEIINEVDNRLD